MIDLFAAAAEVERLALVRWIATADHVYPVLSALHILSLALVIGPILIVDLRLLGGVRWPGLAVALPALARVAAFGAVAALATGALLASVQLAKYLANPAFQMKMALLALAIVNAVWLSRRLARKGWPLEAVGADGRTRLQAALSLVVWLAVLLAGRWIAFVQ